MIDLFLFGETRNTRLFVFDFHNSLLITFVCSDYEPLVKCLYEACGEDDSWKELPKAIRIIKFKKICVKHYNGESLPSN